MTETEPIRTSEATFALRTGGVLVYGTNRLRVERDDERTEVRLDDVVGMSHDMFDWFLGVLSIALIGFGIVSFDRNGLGGFVFAALGVLSLYQTYRKRGKLTFTVAGRARPLAVYPETPDAAYEELRPFMDGTEPRSRG